MANALGFVAAMMPHIVAGALVLHQYRFVFRSNGSSGDIPQRWELGLANPMLVACLIPFVTAVVNDGLVQKVAVLIGMLGVAYVVIMMVTFYSRGYYGMLAPFTLLGRPKSKALDWADVLVSIGLVWLTVVAIFEGFVAAKNI